MQTHPVEEIFPPNLRGAEIPDYLLRLKAAIYSIENKGIGHHSRYDCLEGQSISWQAKKQTRSRKNALPTLWQNA